MLRLFNQLKNKLNNLIVFKDMSDASKQIFTENEQDADVEAREKQEANIIPFTLEETEALARYLEHRPIKEAYHLFNMVLDKLPE